MKKLITNLIIRILYRALKNNQRKRLIEISAEYQKHGKSALTEYAQFHKRRAALENQRFREQLLSCSKKSAKGLIQLRRKILGDLLYDLSKDISRHPAPGEILRQSLLERLAYTDAQRHD